MALFLANRIHYQKEEIDPTTASVYLQELTAVYSYKPYMKTDFDGPYNIDISADERSIAIVFSNGDNSKTVRMSCAEWKEALTERVRLVKHYEEVQKHGTPTEQLDADLARSIQHSDTSEILRDTFREQGVILTEGGARDFLGALAPLVINDIGIQSSKDRQR